MLLFSHFLALFSHFFVIALFGQRGLVSISKHEKVQNWLAKIKDQLKCWVVGPTGNTHCRLDGAI